MSDKFVIKDSGERKSFDSGMVRDTADNKIDYTLILDGPMFERWAQHLTTGAQKYAKRNWMKASDAEELDRFVQSATRHFFQWVHGDRDEDHAAAVFFNINGAEYVRARVEKEAFARMSVRPGEEVGGGGQDISVLERIGKFYD